jgi:S1-C subfamily serine protease
MAQSDTFAVVSPWVVAVVQPKGQGLGKGFRYGSGFVSSNGYVVTAAHVIESERSPVFIAVQGEITLARLRPAKLVRIDRENDIAILDGGYKPPGGLLAQQTPAASGDEVWIFGYELPGNKVAILRIARGSIGQRFDDALQLDGPIVAGFSGGPVTTRGGRVVGIVSFGFRSSQANLSYIVPDALIQAELVKLEPKIP